MADSQVSDFMAFSGCNDPAAAAQYLEVASGNLEYAVQLFMADDPNPINPNPINYKTNILSIFQTSQPLCNMCNLPATLICNDCRLVFYCCSDCAAYGAAAHSNVCDLLQERCLVNDDYEDNAQAFDTIMEDISDLFDLSPKTYNQRHDSEILVDLLGCCRRRFTCHIFPQLLRGLFENLDCISNGKEEVRGHPSMVLDIHCSKLRFAISETQVDTMIKINGKYSKRCRSNIAVIIDRVVFISPLPFYCLLLNHSFPTNPNKITNCFKLFSLFQLYNYIAPASLFDF